MAKIHKLARKGDLAAVVSMLDAGTDVNTREKVTGATLMHIATGNAFMEMMQLLVDRGADLSAQSLIGTPLHHADSPEAAQLLIASGVETDVRSKSGRTPLHAAAELGKPEMVKFFLENGADVNAKTEKGKMPLDFTTDQEVKELLQAADGVTREPTKFEAWVDRAAAPGESIMLDNSVRKGNVGKVRQLLEKGFTSEDALWLALAGDLDSGVILHANIISWIAAGNRMSPAHSEIALLLIAAGCDIGSPTEVGLTALGRAKRWEGFPPVAVRVTYAPGGAITALGILMTPDDEDPVLLRSELGFSPLHVAVINDDADVITALLAKGADTEARTADDETPLHWAALYAVPAAARLLIAAGADVNARTAELGDTPLAWTSRWLADASLQAADRANVEAVAMALREHGGIE